MGTTTHSIEVAAPLSAVYNQWTQFEEFPRFMEGVEEVRQEDNKRLFWRAKIGGRPKAWEAEITEQVPDRKIAWQSVDGSANSGVILFEELASGRTRVTATIEYEPEGFIEKTGDALGIPSSRVAEDLERFRKLIEERGRESGGWRGVIGKEETSQASEAPSPSSAPGMAERAYERPTESEGAIREREGAVTAEEGIREREGAVREREDAVTREVPLSEEEVRVGKKTVSAGDVKLHKTVSSEPVNVPVELKREDAVIERVPATEVKSGSSKPFQEEHIEVPLSREEAIVEKETHVVGGVRVRKTEEATTETVRGEARREDVDIDESGKATPRRRDPEI